MNTQKSLSDGADLAVLVRGNGFYYTVRRFVGEVVEARRKRNAIRHTAQELDRFPDYLKKDIDWPAIGNHEDR